MFLLFFSSGFSENQAPKASIDKTSYDFGTVRRGAKVETTFILSNAGEAELIIAGMRMSIPGLKIKAMQKIPPGKESPLSVEFDTSAATGDVNGQAILYTNDPQKPYITLEVKGHIESLIELQPKPALFLSAFRWEIGKKESSLLIINKDSKPLKILDMKKEGDEYTPQLSATEEGRRYKLTVKLNAGAESGKAEGRITIVTDHETLRIPVFTFVKEKVYLVPDYLNFGRIDLEQIENDPEQLKYRTISIFVYKYQGTDFQIQIQSSPQFLSIEKTPKQGHGSVINIPGQGETAVFELAVSPVKERLKRGKYDDSITLTTNDKDFPVIKIPVTCEIS